jgi:hypothetical protein
MHHCISFPLGGSLVLVELMELLLNYVSREKLLTVAVEKLAK